MYRGEIHIFEPLEDVRGEETMPDALRKRAVDFMGLWARTGSGHNFENMERHNLKIMIRLSPLYRRCKENEPKFYAPRAVLIDRDERIKALLVVMIFNRKEIRIERVSENEFFGFYAPIIKKGGEDDD